MFLVTWRTQCCGPPRRLVWDHGQGARWRCRRASPRRRHCWNLYLRRRNRGIPKSGLAATPDFTCCLSQLQAWILTREAPGRWWQKSSRPTKQRESGPSSCQWPQAWALSLPWFKLPNGSRPLRRGTDLMAILRVLAPHSQAPSYFYTFECSGNSVLARSMTSK